jgi:hypothetical protein
VGDEPGLYPFALERLMALELERTRGGGVLGRRRGGGIGRGEEAWAANRESRFSPWLREITDAGRIALVSATRSHL